jgi:nicotinamidase-related amidase
LRLTYSSAAKPDLHGNVPDSCPVVLLLVDVINDLDFPDNSALRKAAPILGRNIAALKKRCKEVRIPVIYVNDNRDKWRSIFRRSWHTAARLRGRPIVGREGSSGRG